MKRPANIWDKGIAAVVLLIVGGFYGYVGYSVPVFEALFRESETKLPISTQIVFETYLYWFVFVALGVVGVLASAQVLVSGVVSVLTFLNWTLGLITFRFRQV